MPIQFRCDHCSHTLSIGTHKVGSTIHCPICLGIVHVRSAASSSDAPAADTDPGSWWQDSAPSAAMPLSSPLPSASSAPTASAASAERFTSAAVPAPAGPQTIGTASATAPPAGRRVEPPPPRKSVAPAASSRPLWIGTAIGGGIGLIVLLGVVAGALPSAEQTLIDEGPPEIAQVTVTELPTPVVKVNTEEKPGEKPGEQPARVQPLPPATEKSPPAEPVKPAPPVEVARKPVAAPPPPAVARPEEPKDRSKAPAEKLVVKRRFERTEADLLNQIKHAQVLSLDRTLARAESTAAIQAARMAAARGRTNLEGTLALLDRRLDLAGLPLRRGEECHLTPSASEHLETGSVALRGMLSTATVARRIGLGAAAPEEGAAQLAKLLMSDSGKFSKWLKAEAVPALMQMLMAENEAIREVLVDQLSRIEGKEASEALAQRAIFDLHPRVRAQAIEALSKRPAREYRTILLKGFEYPWPVVADHAAEAVVTLKMKDAVPALLAFLDKPDPQAPYNRPGAKTRYVKDLVRINHLMNCLMCHPPSLQTTDKVRGLVPRTDRPISVGVAYYASPQGTFVRADTTYLKQDFSVQLPVDKPGKWPALQRFDFVTRERIATDSDLKASVVRKNAGPTPQQQSTFFALRELTGKDPGPTVEDWKKLFLGRTLEVRRRYQRFTAASALAVDETGRAYVVDGKQILLQEGDGKAEPWLAADAGKGWTGLALDRSGKLVGGRINPSQVARVDRDTQGIKTLGTKLDSRPLGPTRRLLADRVDGVYFSQEPGEGKNTGGVLYLSPLGSVTRMPVQPGKVRGLAFSPDGKTLYVAYGNASEVLSYPVESAGVLGKGKVHGRLTAGVTTPGFASDLAVDASGVVYVLNSAARQIETYGPEGALLGRTLLEETPVACTMGGEKRQTLYVLTRTSLYAVRPAEPLLTAGR